MNKTDRRFRILDWFYIGMAVLPFLLLIVLQILTDVPAEGMSVSGARIFFVIPMPLQDFPVTESQLNSLAVLIALFFFCRYLTHGLKERPELRRQHLAEWIVEKVDGLVNENMGQRFAGYAPFIIAVLGLSACSSLMSLLGLYPPTSDLNIVMGWAILVFVLILYYKMKCGIGYYLKGFLEPVAVLAPINVISEFATPISMGFRHYGNVLSGTVVSALIAFGLGGLSEALFGWLPGFLSDIPFLQIGLPALLSVYFDIFSGCLQAFIFAMLTMMYVAGGFPAEEYERRQSRKLLKTKK